MAKRNDKVNDEWSNDNPTEPVDSNSMANAAVDADVAREYDASIVGRPPDYVENSAAEFVGGEGFQTRDFASESLAWESVGDMVTVRMLTDNQVDGKVVVYDVETLEPYLLPKDSIKFTVRNQSISRTVLREAERPYNWAEEIQSVSASVPEMTLAMLAAGHIRQKPINAREVIAALLSRGTLPVKKDVGNG